MNRKNPFIAFLCSLGYPLIYYAGQFAATFILMFVLALRIGIEYGLSGEVIDQTDMIGRLTYAITTEYAQWSSIICGIIVGLAVLLIIKLKRQRVAEALRIEPLPLREILVLALLGIFLNIFTVYTISVVPIPGEVMEQYNELVGDAIIGSNFLLTVVATGIIIPVIEEVIFRGMVYNSLRRGMGVAAAVVLQMLIFAAAHVIPLQVAYVLPASLVLGLVYIWCRSLVGCAVVHIAYNSFSVILNFIPARSSGAEVVSVPPMRTVSGRPLWFRFTRTYLPGWRAAEVVIMLFS